MNLVMAENRDRRVFVPATMKTLRGLIKRSDKLKRSLRHAGSLDPAHAVQANDETRKSMFTKSEQFAISISQVSEQKGWLQQNMANDRRQWC